MLFVRLRGQIDALHQKYVVLSELEMVFQIAFDIESISLIIIRGIAVKRVLREVVLVRKEGTDPAKLKDALAAVQNGQFILAHQLLAELLIIEIVRDFTAPAFTGVETVDGFLAQ